MPEVNCGSGVMVKVEVGVADVEDVGVMVVTVSVMVSVAVDVMVSVVVTVTVPAVGETGGWGVLEGVGLLVFVAVGLGDGVWLGSTVSVAVGVEVAASN